MPESGLPVKAGQGLRPFYGGGLGHVGQFLIIVITTFEPPVLPWNYSVDHQLTL